MEYKVENGEITMPVEELNKLNNAWELLKKEREEFEKVKDLRLIKTIDSSGYTGYYDEKWVDPDSEIAILSERVKKLESEIRRLENELRSAKRTIDSDKETIKDLESKLDVFKNLSIKEFKTFIKSNRKFGSLYTYFAYKQFQNDRYYECKNE